MSKGQRSRKSGEEKQRLKREREEFERKKAKVRKVTAIITTAVILAIVLVTVIGTIAYNVRMNKGEYLRREIAAATSQTEVDGAMMNYFFNDTYNTFVDYYGSYVSYFGLDTTYPLRQQASSDTESWFDYFMNGAKSTVTNVLALHDAALAEGRTLSDAEIAAVRARADNTDYGLYGRGVNTDDIYNAKLLEALAYRQQFAKQTEFAPGASEIAEFAAENEELLSRVDYLEFPLYYTETGMSDAEVQEWADKLAACDNADDFKAVVREVLLAEDASMSEEDIANQMEALTATGVLYSEGDTVAEWAFDAKAGDTFILPDTENTTYTVYLLTKAAYRDNSTTVTVRHILLSDADYGEREDTLAAANELLEEFLAGDRSVDSFALMALEHSDDEGSYYNGGRYQYVAAGTMVETFDDWCFDDTRKPGDTGIVETEYGVHIMYFEDHGLKAWEADAADALVNEQITAYLAEITETYPVVFDENVLDMIPD